MQKSVTTPEPARQSLAQKIGAVVRQVMGGDKEVTVKAVQTRTSESQSSYVERWDDGRGVSIAENADGTVSVVVSQAQTTPEPEAQPSATPVQQTAGTITSATIAEAVAAAIAPLQQSINKFDGRLVTLEGAPVPSGQIAKSMPIGPRSTAPKYPHFEKHLLTHAGMSAGQKLTKAAITAGSFTYGLHTEEADRFLDYIVDESKVFTTCRQVRVNGKEKLIPRIGLGGKVLRKGSAGVDPGETVTINTGQIAVNCPEVVGIVRIADDSLEDNIEGDALVEHILGMMGRASRNELEAAAFHGDTAVADATGINDRFDGWVKKAIAGGHVVDATGDADRYWPGAQGGKASRAIMSLPTKFRRDLTQMRWLMHPDVAMNYNDVLAALGISEAYLSITGLKDMPLRSVPVLQAPAIRTDLTVGAGADGTVVMLTDVQNLIFAISRDITIESQRVARARSTDYVISMRASVEIEQPDAVAVYNKAKVKVPAA